MPPARARPRRRVSVPAGPTQSPVRDQQRARLLQLRAGHARHLTFSIDTARQPRSAGRHRCDNVESDRHGLAQSCDPAPAQWSRPAEGFIAPVASNTVGRSVVARRPSASPRNPAPPLPAKPLHFAHADARHERHAGLIRSAFHQAIHDGRGVVRTGTSCRPLRSWSPRRAP